MKSKTQYILGMYWSSKRKTNKYLKVGVELNKSELYVHTKHSVDTHRYTTDN